MSQEYVTVYGASRTINVAGNDFLRLLTLGCWDKAGIPRPLSADDALLVSRLLYNYAHIRENSDEIFNSYFKRNGYPEKEDEEDLAWIRDLAAFFKYSGGLIDPEAES